MNVKNKTSAECGVRSAECGMFSLQTLAFSLFLSVTCLTLAAATLNVRRVRNSNQPPAPTNFVVSLIGNQPTNVFLSWGNAATNYASITIQRSTNATEWTQVTNIAGNRTGFTNLFTWTNLSVYYRLFSVASNGLPSAFNNQ